MEPVGTVLHAAATAPLTNRPRERTHGSAVPEPGSAGDAESQRSRVYLSPRTAAVWVVLRAVEQFRAISQLGQGVEDAATTGIDIGREHAAGQEVESRLDLYA